MESIRAFIAIEIPAVIQEKVTAGCTLLYALPDKISWVKPHNLHLSLRFLGGVSPKRIPKIKAALLQAASACVPFPIGFTDIGVFPDKKRPRVIWLGLEDTTEQLEKLKQELDRTLTGCGFAPEKRPFKPHLTLGRIRKLKDTRQLISKLEVLPLPELAPLKVKQIQLMHSQLRPQGPIYTKLETACLQQLIHLSKEES